MNNYNKDQEPWTSSSVAAEGCRRNESAPVNAGLELSDAAHGICEGTSSSNQPPGISFRGVSFSNLCKGSKVLRIAR